MSPKQGFPGYHRRDVVRRVGRADPGEGAGKVDVMAMLVLILDTRDSRDSRATIDAATAERLAELGVTRVTVARDTVTEAVVLEGWAFDAQSSAAEAARLVAGPDPARSLKPVLQTLLHQLDEAAPITTAAR